MTRKHRPYRLATTHRPRRRSRRAHRPNRPARRPHRIDEAKPDREFWIGSCAAGLVTIGWLVGWTVSSSAQRTDPLPLALVAEQTPPFALVAEPASPRDPGPMQALRPLPPLPLATEADRASPTVEQSRSRVRQTEQRPRRRYRSRRRSRNRYPGRIPTPAEWQPPEGPVRIALQAGHWRANEAPRELSGLRDNGTSWRGTAEWEVNLEIARRAASMLEDLGYEVDVLPAVVPPGYRAHLFISIHADGSNDPRASGYRIAGPRRDATGRASRVVDLMERSYRAATGLTRLPNVTSRMRNYYAFNYRRYEHALHPMTIGIIIETGFLTSARDRRVILRAPQRAATGIVEAVKAFSVTQLSEIQDARAAGEGM